jgi:hypothetical protein
VAVYGKTAVVGGFANDGYRGAAYVFVRSGTNWIRQYKLTASDAAPSDLFGAAVALYGSTAVIGAFGKDYDTGAAYVFAPLYPTVSKLTPNAGPTTGGNTVTIAGSGFVPGATIKFGSAGAALATTFVSGTQLKVIAPAHAPGTVPVFVTTAGTSAATNNDLYAFGAPGVTGLSPHSGSTAGGNTVTITGSGFVPGATVKFGSAGAALATMFVSGTQLKVIAPAHTAGTVPVFVTTTAGTSAASNNDLYTYGP